MNKNLLLLLLGMVLGCNHFETQKISSEVVAREELQQIDWEEVEKYPSFETCKDQTDKKQQQNCFKTQLSELIYQNLTTHHTITADSIHEKIRLYISIDAQGAPIIDSIKHSPYLISKLPELTLWIEQSVENLPPIYPAQKRGIPVATSFVLPIFIQSEGF